MTGWAGRHKCGGRFQGLIVQLWGSGPAVRTKSGDGGGGDGALCHRLVNGDTVPRLTFFDSESDLGGESGSGFDRRWTLVLLDDCHDAPVHV